MTRRAWFLPEAPDVLGMLRDQLAATEAGMDAFAEWARGDEAKVTVLRECEHAADELKRTLRQALTTAFTTPVDPEELFELSRGADAVLNGAKDAAREAEVMSLAPDEAIAEMAALLLEGVRRLGEACSELGRDAAAATAAADEAVKTQRRAERVYRRAMSALLANGDLREVTARREMYRRLSRIGSDLVDVAERVWYLVLKAG